jgi:hypothetical protein
MSEKKEHLSKSAHDTTPKTTIPVVIDLGTQKKSDIEKLEKGEGKLMLEVDLAVEHARSRLPEEDRNKIVVPVVMIYRKKRKRAAFPIPPVPPFNLFR